MNQEHPVGLSPESTRLQPLASLTSEQVRELFDDAVVEALEPGQTLFSQGDHNEQTLYVLRGRIRLHDGERVADTVEAGSEKALHPLADEEPRRLTAVADGPAEVLRIDRERLDILLTWGDVSAPETDVVMCEAGVISINKADWLKTMIKSPTFRNLPAANIETLLNRLEPIIVKAGEVVIRQGDVGDYFYMIDQGTALVTRNPDDDEDSVELAELERGATFGEAALISDNPRNATVSMMTDGVLLRLAKDDFLELLKQPTLQWLDYATAAAMVRHNACWVDVRHAAEFAHGHLPGAINIPMRDLHRRAHELDRDTNYICVCQTGRRSSAAAFVLMQYGLRAGVLKDGMQSVEDREKRKD